MKSHVETAKEVGVVVKEGETKEVTINNEDANQKGSEILTDLNKQDKAVQEATEKQKLIRKPTKIQLKSIKKQ